MRLIISRLQVFRVLASVSEAQLHLCVCLLNYILCKIINEGKNKELQLLFVLRRIIFAKKSKIYNEVIQ